MKPIRTTTVIAAVLCGTTASADVTAQQVWDNWSSQMALYDQGFKTTGETMSGDTLTISGVTIEMSDDEATVNAALGDIALTENGDGTVSITTEASYPITLEFTPAYGDPSTVNLTVEQTGTAITVSGDPDAMVYDIASDRYAISVDSIEGEIEEDVLLDDAVFAMLDLAGQYSVTEDDLTRIAYEFAVGAVDIDVLFSEVGGESIVSFAGDMADMAMSAEVSAPIDMDMDADVPPFNEGLAMAGGYTVGSTSYVFDFNADGEAATGSVSIDSASVDFAFNMDTMSYFGAAQGLDLSVLVPDEFPFPIEASMAEYGFGFLVPLSQGEDGPRDAKFSFNLTELQVSEILWGLIDTQGILPHDPVTVALTLDAQVTPFFDFLDPDQMAAAEMSEIPGELNGLQISGLTVKGAGAEITGDGAFTIDNSDPQAFFGYPRPEGQMSFAINGVNGLVDNLIQMGLIPEEEAMMPRMMLGMFATPVGDDMLTSTIEVNNEGHILANGQRLR